MKTWIAVLAGGSCAVACILWSLRDGPAEPAARVPAARAVKPVAMAPSSNPSSTLEPVRPAAAAPAAAEPATGDSAQAPPANPVRTRGEVRDGLEAVFQNDPYDAAWSQQTAATLTRGIHAVLPPGSRLERLDCRGTLCRIETSHADLEAYRVYTLDTFQGHDTRVITGAAFQTVVGEPVPGKPVVAVAFVARDGHDLPDLEPRLGTR